MAWGRRCAIASRDSTAPLGLPGRLITIVLCRRMATPRERMAVGVLSTPLRRISSARPGMTRSATSRVASGVMSRGPSPVPPVVRRISTWPESQRVRNWLRREDWSSEVMRAEVTCQPSWRQRSTSAGPERSSRSPRETESLTVRMAIRMEDSYKLSVLSCKSNGEICGGGDERV